MCTWWDVIFRSATIHKLSYMICCLSVTVFKLRYILDEERFAVVLFSWLWHLSDFQLHNVSVCTNSKLFNTSRRPWWKMTSWDFQCDVFGAGMRKLEWQSYWMVADMLTHEVSEGQNCHCNVQTDRHLFNGLFSKTTSVSGHQKG